MTETLEQQPQPGPNGGEQHPPAEPVDQEQRPPVADEARDGDPGRQQPAGVEPVPLSVAESPSPSLLIQLERELDLSLDPSLKTAAGAVFALQNRLAVINAKQQAVNGDERLSDRAKADDKQMILAAEAAKPFPVVEAALKELIAAQKEAHSAWQRVAAEGGDSPRTIQGEAEVRQLMRDMGGAERVAFVLDGVRSHDMLVVRAALMAPSVKLTGLTAEQVETLRRAAGGLVDPGAARRAEAIRLAILRLRAVTSAYTTEIRRRGVRAKDTPRWAVAPASTWGEAPKFEEPRR